MKIPSNLAISPSEIIEPTQKKQRKRQVFQTTAFQAAIVNALVFILVALLGFGFVIWAGGRYVMEQIDDRLNYEIDSLVEIYRSSGRRQLVQTIQDRINIQHSAISFHYSLIGSRGEWLGGILVYPPMSRFLPYSIDDPSRLIDREFLAPYPNSIPQGAIRVVERTLLDGSRLFVIRSVQAEYAMMHWFFFSLISATLVLFIVGQAVSVWFGSRTLQRVNAVSRTAHEIMRGDLKQRLPAAASGNEFDALGRELNMMLARIEQLMYGMKEISDNIAHDLRSPLTRLKMRFEVLLLESHTPQEYTEEINKAIEDIDQLIGTFNAMLTISQAEAGLMRLEPKMFDLRDLVAQIADFYEPLAEDKQQQLSWYVADQPLILCGDRKLLMQALVNLLDNAIKYSPEQTAIEMLALQIENEIIFTIADQGCGIPETERERVLERFVRLDTARSTQGNGLGLSLVNAVTHLHGGTIRLEDHQPGLKVVLTFAVI